MRLPEAERAIIDARKLREYILSFEHPVGRFKALYFARLGFAEDNWQELRSELERIAREGEAEIAEKTDYGQKYLVSATLVGPARSAQIVTVWIVLDDETAPRFVTAYPES